MLRVIRQQEARDIELRFKADSKELKFLSSKYVLDKDSLSYFNRYGSKIDFAFKNYLYTQTESCIHYMNYYLVNGSLINITLNNSIPDTYDICLYSQVDFKLIRKEAINKYVLIALKSLYGLYTQNALYLAGFKWLYRFVREPEEVEAYDVMVNTGKYIKHTPYVKLIYSDGSMEQLIGQVTIDTLINKKLKVGKLYKRDLLDMKNKTYSVMTSNSPFD